MSNIFICKYCGKSFEVKQFGRHLWKIHGQKYECYVKNNLNEFTHLGWKTCSECNNGCKSTSDKCGKCYTKTHQIKNDQYISCKYCNEQFHSKGIAKHLKFYHNIDFLDYVKENLGDFSKFGWCNCVICGHVMRTQSKIKNQPSCSPECSSEVRKTWVGENAPRFGAILSDDTKQKISESNTGKEGLCGNSNPACRTEVRAQISRTRMERGVAKGEKNGMYGKTHTPETIAKIFSHRQMNKLERLVADELDNASIPYHFQYFIVDNGICKSYDFKIMGKPIIIEADGDFWHGNPNRGNHYKNVDAVRKNDVIKTEMAEKQGLKIIRLWESDVKKDPSIVRKRLSEFYL